MAEAADPTRPKYRIHFEPKTRITVGAIIGSVVGVVVLLVGLLLWRHFMHVRRAQGDPEVAHAGEDPFMNGTDVKTVTSHAQSSRPTTPPAPLQTDMGAAEVDARPTPVVTAKSDSEEVGASILRAVPSGEFPQMPELSRTFVANLRATTRSPLPG